MVFFRFSKKFPNHVSVFFSFFLVRYISHIFKILTIPKSIFEQTQIFFVLFRRAVFMKINEKSIFISTSVLHKKFLRMINLFTLKTISKIRYNF